MSILDELEAMERVFTKEFRFLCEKVETIKPDGYYINKKCQKFRPDVVKRKDCKTASLNRKSPKLIKPYGINDCQSSF